MADDSPSGKVPEQEAPEPETDSATENTKISLFDQAAVDEASVAFTYEFPITLLSGIGGPTPDLSLKYDSRDKDPIPQSLVSSGLSIFHTSNG